MTDKQTDSSADRGAVDAWNQVGIYMETAQETWNRLAKRNFDFWKEVSGSLRSGPVTADTLAANAGRAMSAAMETAQDLWLTTVEPPSREVYAQTLPTAFVYFSKVSADTDGKAPRGQRAKGRRKNTYDNPDPVHIAVHHQREQLDETAKITISGNPTNTDDSAADALAALDARLRARREGSARSYLLEVLNPADEDAKNLVPGTYVGLVYLTDPPLPLANLRVVVE